MRLESESLRYRWVIILSCATFIALVYAGRTVFSSVSSGRAIDWTRQVGYEFMYWYVWAALTPIVIWFAGRFQIERAGWRRVVLALVGFGLLIAPLQGAFESGIAYSIEAFIRHTPGEELARRRSLILRGVVVESFGNFLIYLVIVGSHYAFAYYLKFREREMRSVELEGRLAQAELQNLKMQLHPHFLFNTLHTISVLMMRNVQAANRMLIRLSDLLRVTLETAGTEEVSLKQELDFLSGYLEIERTRFHDRLTVKMEIDSATLDARVPNLILQPLVENAIRHGIARRPEMGWIKIKASRAGAELCLEISDNGSGLAVEGLANLKKGVGLSNTEARLKQLYGSRQRFELLSLPEGGVRVQVVIPFHTDAGQD
jgi:two-component sensor histidine kinase